MFLLFLAIRKLACGSLCLYVNALRKDNKISQEKLFLEQNLERCCFGPSKTFLPMMLSQLQNDKSITVLLSMNYLESSRYKQQMVPHSHQFRYKDLQKGLFKAHFRGEASMVKVLEITPGKYIPGRGRGVVLRCQITLCCLCKGWN